MARELPMMPSNLHEFLFDVNFGFGDESLYSIKNEDNSNPHPPIDNILLLSDETSFLLTTDETMSLT